MSAVVKKKVYLNVCGRFLSKIDKSNLKNKSELIYKAHLNTFLLKRFVRYVYALVYLMSILVQFLNLVASIDVDLEERKYTNYSDFLEKKSTYLSLNTQSISMKNIFCAVFNTTFITSHALPLGLMFLVLMPNLSTIFHFSIRTLPVPDSYSSFTGKWKAPCLPQHQPHHHWYWSCVNALDNGDVWGCGGI